MSMALLGAQTSDSAGVQGMVSSKASLEPRRVPSLADNGMKSAHGTLVT